MSGEWGEEPGRIQKQPVSCPVLWQCSQPEMQKREAKERIPGKGEPEAYHRKEVGNLAEPTPKQAPERGEVDRGRMTWMVSHCN